MGNRITVSSGDKPPRPIEDTRPRVPPHTCGDTVDAYISALNGSAQMSYPESRRCAVSGGRSLGRGGSATDGEGTGAGSA